MGKCVFNRKWLTDQKYKSSVREFKSDKHSAICCLCNKIIDLGKMGEYALISHMKGKKHIQCTPATTMTPIAAAFKSAPKTSVDPMHSTCSTSELTVPLPTDDPQSGNILPTQANTVTLDLFVSRNDTLKAEILWDLHTVTQHCSFKSSDDVSKLFPIMFPDIFELRR